LIQLLPFIKNTFFYDGGLETWKETENKMKEIKFEIEKENIFV